MFQGALKGSLPAWTPTSRGPETPSLCAPTPTLHLCYRSWRGAGRPPRGNSSRVMAWCRQGRAPIAFAPRAWSPACSTLGKGCRGSPKRGGGGQKSRAEAEEPAAHPSPYGRPGQTPTWAAEQGEPAVAAARRFVLERASSLSLSHSHPHPRYCGMTSARPGAD